jgi:hypothetical protein
VTGVGAGAVSSTLAESTLAESDEALICDHRLRTLVVLSPSEKSVPRRSRLGFSHGRFRRIFRSVLCIDA